MGLAEFSNSRKWFQACLAATEDYFEQGNIGAGTGTTIGKLAGPQFWMRGSLGSTSLFFGKLIVGALAVVITLGDIYNEDGTVLAGAINEKGKLLAEIQRGNQTRGENPFFRQHNTSFTDD